MRPGLKTPRLAKPVNEYDHANGSATAVATLVEYGDYQCENTKKAQPIIRDLQHQSRDWLRYVYRHFPQTKQHKYAELAAQAAEAAAAQGMFWEMHEYLFEHQDALDLDSLINHAELIGLDIDQFENDIRKNRYIDVVRDDLQSGKESGVKQTPTFFINGIKYEGPLNTNALLAEIKNSALEIE